MTTTTLNGWEIFYKDRGEGEPILLVHGFLMDHSMFDHQSETLKENYRVITPDLRCHGESEHRAEEHSQWDLMEDHISLLDQLGIEKAVFGGVSQGGFQSLRAALKYPDRVKGLILIDTQAGPENEALAPMYEAFAQMVAENGYTEDILDVSVVSMFSERADAAIKEHWKKRWSSQPNHSAFAAMTAVSRRDDITDRLGEISAPAIVIHGEDDVAIEIELAQALANGLPNLVEFLRIEGAGHSSTVEKPEPITGAIQDFLTKIL